MVSLIDDFTKYVLQRKNEYLTNFNLECFCYFYLTYRMGANVNQTVIDKLGKSIEKFRGEEKLAAIGYFCGINSQNQSTREEMLRQQLEVALNTEPLSGMHYSTNIYTLLGMYLLAQRLEANVSKLKPYLDQTLSKGNLKDKFLLLIPEKKFNNFAQLNQLEKTFDLLVYFLVNSLGKISFEDKQLIDENFIKHWQEIVTADLDLVDIFILEYYFKNSLKQNFQYKTHDAVSLIKLILSNFQNAINKIVQERRKGHEKFVVKHEYDTQDLVYVMLKPIFHDLTPEEPTPKTGGKGSILDFIIPSEKIGIEIKYIDEEKCNEKKIIKDLKEDIQSYYKYADLEHFIIFVHNPYDKISDKHNFISLAGTQTIDEKTFDITVVVNP